MSIEEIAFLMFLVGQPRAVGNLLACCQLGVPPEEHPPHHRLLMPQAARQTASLHPFRAQGFGEKGNTYITNPLLLIQHAREVVS